MCLSPLGIAKVLLSPEEWEPSTAAGALLLSLSMFVIWLYQELMRVLAGTPEGWENSKKMRPGGQRAGQQQSRSSVLPQAGLSLVLCLEVTSLSSFCIVWGQLVSITASVYQKMMFHD